ncbi:MAG TPA: hypothetical protein EYP17_03215 [Candidatus Latescibacteria bacterium]|nr:hypothetical protein [Candidatus Latescibacterota bacterium]
MNSIAAADVDGDGKLVGVVRRRPARSGPVQRILLPPHYQPGRAGTGWALRRSEGLLGLPEGRRACTWTVGGTITCTLRSGEEMLLGTADARVRWVTL